MIRLAPEDVDAIATRVVELLEERPGAGDLVDAGGVAKHLGVERDWVYERAAELGAVRLGEGPRPRLRFSLAEVDQRYATCFTSRGSQEPESGATKRKARPRRRSDLGTSGPLLPIRGTQTGPEAGSAA